MYVLLQYKHTFFDSIILFFYLEESICLLKSQLFVYLG